jgi:hypothetical protein
VIDAEDEGGVDVEVGQLVTVDEADDVFVGHCATGSDGALDDRWLIVRRGGWLISSRARKQFTTVKCKYLCIREPRFSLQHCWPMTRHDKHLSAQGVEGGKGAIPYINAGTAGASGLR